VQRSVKSVAESLFAAFTQAPRTSRSYREKELGFLNIVYPGQSQPPQPRLLVTVSQELKRSSSSARLRLSVMFHFRRVIGFAATVFSKFGNKGSGK
jgi:hypothetical protein